MTMRREQDFVMKTQQTSSMISRPSAMSDVLLSESVELNLHFSVICVMSERNGAQFAKGARL